VRCAYCGSHLHDLGYCPKTWEGQINRGRLYCEYCRGRDHNTDACPKKWAGPHPVRILDAEMRSEN
jgi:hypothetical protein